MKPSQRRIWIFGAALLFLAGLVSVYVCFIIRKLPWQQPVFDSELPVDLPVFNQKGVLIFSKTNGYRHGSIDAGVDALRTICLKNGWNVYATENAAIFNERSLHSFKVVVFLSTTGRVLTPSQKTSFQHFIESGGGYVGVHSACDTENRWTWYHRFVGTYFRDHTFLPFPMTKATLIVENKNHPATRHLPDLWTRTDEWYNFRDNIRNKDGFAVLMSLDEKSYPHWWPDAMGADHPICWVDQRKGRRMFYTGIGHTIETYSDPNALQLFQGAIQWSGME